LPETGSKIVTARMPRSEVWFRMLDSSVIIREPAVMLKHYRLKGNKGPTRPSALFAVRLDIDNQNSGFRVTEFGHYRGEWLSHSDMDWARDMVCPVSLAEYKECEAPVPLEWPEYLDRKIISYFTRLKRIPIYFNQYAHLYSEGSESESAFIARCTLALLREREGEIDAIRDIFLHRFLQIEKELLISSGEDSWDPELGEKRAAQIRALFSGIREGFNHLALREYPVRFSIDDFTWAGKVDVESSDRLEDLRADLVNQVNRIVEACREKAAQTEIFEVPVRHTQVFIESRAILWS